MVIINTVRFFIEFSYFTFFFKSDVSFAFTDFKYLNIVESGIKHHKPNQIKYLFIFKKYF